MASAPALAIARSSCDDPTLVPEDDESETVAGTIPAELAASRSLSLLVMSPAGTAKVAVPARGKLLLGRASDCDVRIDDAKLSRRHAELRCGAVIELVDLGSRNGSYVRDERLTPNTPVSVRAGESMTIGDTLLVLQGAAVGGDRLRHVWTHGYFEARLEEECSRATRGEGAFAILRLRLPSLGGTTTEAVGIPASMIAWLRTDDILASYAPGEYEVLLPGTRAAGLDDRAADLDRRLTSAGIRARIAVAAFPRDGRTPEALMERTTHALVRTAGSGSDGSASSAFVTGALERMERVVRRVAEGAITVLILGETGVGKEVLARRIHALSPRAQMPLVTINCAALAASLLESELFGHEKGAFTGAVQAKAGLLESASGGTVLLDEVGEMPLELQAKLLRVLEQREVVRVGAVRPRPIDVRFLAATNRDLEREVKAARFREDLYFRLNGVALTIPPLRERAEEIEPLARAFAEQARAALHRPRAPRFSDAAMEALQRYQWPGNIRELRNVVERAVLLCTGDTITSDHLPMEKLGQVLAPSVVLAAVAPVRIGRVQPAAPSAPSLDETIATSADGLERRRILEALEACAGNQSQAAKRLGISRATLVRRIEDYGIPRPRKRD